MLPEAGRALRDELIALFHAEPPTLSDAAFERLALRVFAFQFEHNPAYRAYCERRGRTPDTVAGWLAIPPVPAAAFKELPLISGEAADVARVFRTSGTTRGRERRGEHHVLDIALYDASLRAGFRAFVLPDGARPVGLALVPPQHQAPDSSLAYMVDRVVRELGAPGGDWFAGPDGLDTRRLEDRLRDAEAGGTPVMLLGTSTAFAAWLDALRQRGARHRLPPGSRVLDTGGYKGAGRRVAEDALRAGYAELLGVPDDHVVNEYGMTELLSQYYDTTLRDAATGAAGGRRHKDGPPWLRCVVVDPETLEPLPHGETGLLRHVDLANLGSVAAVQTEDVGRRVAGGFVLAGRATGATPRGCSIAMDLLLRAAEERA